MVRFQDANHRVTEPSFFDSLRTVTGGVPVDLSAFNDIAGSERITTENAMLAMSYDPIPFFCRISPSERSHFIFKKPVSVYLSPLRGCSRIDKPQAKTQRPSQGAEKANGSFY